MTKTEDKSDFKLIKDNPYLAPMVKLCGVNYENFGGFWQCYNDTALEFLDIWALIRGFLLTLQLAI